MIARGLVALSVVLSELWAEETRLCGAGLLGVSFVLAARAPTVLAAALGLYRSSAPPLLATPPDGMGSSPLAVEVAPLVVEAALALFAFSVAIVRSQCISRLIATRRCWTWVVLLRVGLVLLLRVTHSLRRILWCLGAYWLPIGAYDMASLLECAKGSTTLYLFGQLR
jgi:hypothetical protein